MVLALAAIGAIIWFIFIAFIFRVKQSPEAQLRKRLNEMIDQAEASRGVGAKNKKVAIAKAVQQIEPKRESFYVRVIKPSIKYVEGRMQKIAPKAIREQIEEKIFRAGKMGSWSVSQLITCWCLTVAIFGMISLIFLQHHPELNPAQKMLSIVLGLFIGAMVPFAVLNSKIRQRKKQIRKQLPEFMDILCVSVQAGLSFDGAISKMIKRMKGPLIDEFTRMQHDVALGMTHQYALTALAKRCDLEEVYLFTTSIIQAEKLGTSMTRTLKVQSDNMRDRHRQYVKSEALKAPVKVLFPMILFIFPSMFIVLLFPAMFNLMKNLGSK